MGACETSAGSGVIEKLSNCEGLRDPGVDMELKLAALSRGLPCFLFSKCSLCKEDGRLLPGGVNKRETVCSAGSSFSVPFPFSNLPERVRADFGVELSAAPPTIPNALNSLCDVAAVGPPKDTGSLLRMPPRGGLQMKVPSTQTPN